MKQARDYRKYNVRLTSADWQRGSDRVINYIWLKFVSVYLVFVCMVLAGHKGQLAPCCRALGAMITKFSYGSRTPLLGSGGNQN